MGKEYFFQFHSSHNLEEFGLTKLSTFRRYLPEYSLYEFGYAGNQGTKDVWPGLTIHPEKFGFTLCVYDTLGPAWNEILDFLQILFQHDSEMSVQEDDWEEGKFIPWLEARTSWFQQS